MIIQLTVPETTASMPLVDYLEKEILIPRKVRHFLRTRKNVKVDGEVRQFHQTVHAGEVLTLEFLDTDYPEVSVRHGNKNNLAVLYEDEHLLIVNKPVGQKTHPNGPTEDDTLQNDAAAYLAHTGTFPYVVHRLDMETSGCVLFAKNPVVLPILGRMLEQRQIHRTYQAEVMGTFTQDSFTIDQAIGHDRHDKRKRVIDNHTGKKAVTHVTVVKSVGKMTELLVQLETGRTHQIRVHLASLRHPIIGDVLYNPAVKPGERLMLHAVSLELTHPFTHEAIIARAVPGLF